MKTPTKSIQSSNQYTRSTLSDSKKENIALPSLKYKSNQVNLNTNIQQSNTSTLIPNQIGVSSINKITSPFSSIKIPSKMNMNFNINTPINENKPIKMHSNKEVNFNSPLIGNSNLTINSPYIGKIYDSSPFIVRNHTIINDLKNKNMNERLVEELNDFKLDDDEENEKEKGEEIANKQKGNIINKSLEKISINKSSIYKSSFNNNESKMKSNKSNSLIKNDSISDFRQVSDLKNNNYYNIHPIRFQNISSVSYRSQAGKVSSFKSKTNQDSFLIANKVLGIDDFSIYGVFDGHGTQGHIISDHVKNYILDFFSQKRIYKSNTSHISDDFELNSSLIYKKLSENKYNLINFAFNSCENSISNSKFQSNMSGTTCVIVFIVNNKVICANAGDSRAIFSSSNGLQQLSFDHKPDNKGEKDRIIKSGGKVHPSKEYGKYVGPARVWVKSGEYPGLAMSRSIGDFFAKSVGCSCAPEIVETSLDENSKFIVIGSDGIYEVLSNNDIESIVKMSILNKRQEQSASILVDKAVLQWRKECDGQDDITAVIIYF